MKSSDIVAYVYCADIVCPECVVKCLVVMHEASPAALDMTVEDALDQIAEANAIDRYDESSFDSGDFPKVAFADGITKDDRCGCCGDRLLPA